MYIANLSIPTMAPLELRMAALDGEAELAADPADPGAATGLIARLGAANPPGWLEALPVTLFDRLCAEVFAQEFSPRIDCRSTCSTCAEPFNFGFAIADLTGAQDRAAAKSGLTPTGDGYWRAGDGLELRAPTLADLAIAPDRRGLVKRLVRGGKPQLKAVEKLLAAAAPLLSLPIATECPHCAKRQQVPFDMSRFLVASIAAERPFLIRETHLIASRYGWDYGTITTLSRRDRQAYAALIASERSAALKWRAG